MSKESQAYLFLFLMLFASLAGCISNPEGDIGPVGPQGDEGPQGLPGQNGSSLHAVSDYEALPECTYKLEGHLYFVEEEKIFSLCKKNEWVTIDLTGATGDQGPIGASGEDGVNGNDGVDGINGQDGTDGLDGLNGTSLLVDTVIINASDMRCPEGGIEIHFGHDHDNSGILEIVERESSVVVCHGENGQDFVPPTTPPEPLIAPFAAEAVLGSWRSSMTKTNYSIAAPGDCTDADSWLREDGDSMMNMMNATGQNTYISHVGSASTSSCDWLKMVDLLHAAGNQTGRSIWMGLPDHLSYDEYVQMMLAYADLEVEDHVGMRVMADDFHQAMKAPWYLGPGMSAQELSNLSTLLDDVGGRDIPFMPYLPAEMAMVYAAPVVALGVASCASSYPGCDNANHSFHPDHLIAATWNITLTEYEAQHGLQLTGFMHETVYASTIPQDRDVRLLVTFDGNEIENTTLYESSIPVQRVQRLNLTIPPTFGGEHQLTIRIKAVDLPISRTWNKMAFFGDLALETQVSRLALGIDDAYYQNEHPTLSKMPGHIAQSNSDWRLDDVFDGLLFRWGAPSSASAHDHAEFVSWLCGHMVRPCIEVYWGNLQWNSPSGTMGDHVDFLQATAEHTDGLIFWRLDNQQFNNAEGYYAENRLASSTAPILSMYPAFIPATEGWFQSWSWNANASGQLNLTFDDSIQSSDILNRMRVSIWINGTLAHEHDPGKASQEPAVSLPVLLGQEIDIRVETVDSFGSLVWWVEVDGTLDDQPLQRNVMTYNADAGTYTKDIYQFARAAFLGLDLSIFV